MTGMPVISGLREALLKTGFPFDFLENRGRLRSAAAGAAYWGIDLGATAPALILRAEKHFLLLILSGSSPRVDLEALSREIAEKGLRMATAAEIQEHFGIRPGEVPLFGLGLPTLVDRSLLTHEFVYGGSGDPETTLKVDPRALLALNEGSQVVEVPCQAGE